MRQQGISPVTDAKTGVSPGVSPVFQGETPRGQTPSQTQKPALSPKSGRKSLAERVLERARRENGQTEPPGEVSHLAELEPAPPSKPLKTSPEGLTLEAEALAILAEIRPAEPASPPRWLELAEAARLEAVATFAPERQAHALAGYLACCEGKPARLIAAHAVALALWARRGRAVPIGHCQDAACLAVGLEPESVQWGTPIPKRGKHERP